MGLLFLWLLHKFYILLRVMLREQIVGVLNTRGKRR